jgi:fucose permease
MFEGFHSAILLYIVVSLIGLAMAPMFAAAFTIPAELRLKGKLSTATSIFIVVSGIGDMAFPAAAGVFLGQFGIDALQWLILILICVCFALYLFAYPY